MGNYLVFNTSDNSVKFKTSGKPSVIIDRETMTQFVVEPDTKYRIKRHHTTVAKFWVGSDGSIIKYENYLERLFISIPTLSFPIVNFPSQLMQLQTLKDTQPTVQMIFICKKIEEVKIDNPPPLLLTSKSDKYFP